MEMTPEATLARIRGIEQRIRDGEEVPHEERGPNQIGQDAAVHLGRLIRRLNGTQHPESEL